MAGDDDTHFRRPTFLVFMDANTMYLADGYDNTRVIKYDMNGKKLAAVGRGRHAAEREAPGLLEQRARHRASIRRPGGCT